MQPTRDGRGTLVDLLERLLDKGMVLNLDLIIEVAGIPLIGLNLRAVIASVETMLEYGLMDGWDTRIREHAMKVHGSENAGFGRGMTGDSAG